MALQRLDILIRAARDATGNANYTATQGIKQREFVRYANDAQQRLFNKILGERSSLFTKEAFLNVTANTVSYPLPTDTHLRGNLIKVEYSPDGNPLLYRPLDMRSPRQEISAPGYPTSYFLRDGSIILSPIPTQSATNGLRLNYQYDLPIVDIRRGLVSAHGLSSITFATDSTLITETEDDLSNGWVDYISVVDRDGAQIATAIPVTGYNSTTKVISCTLTSAQDAAVTNGSHYVVFGANATSHSGLMPLAERYVITYMSTLIQMRDSNSESGDTQTVLQALEREILDSVAELEEDLVAIPILDTSMLTYADDL